MGAPPPTQGYSECVRVVSQTEKDGREVRSERWTRVHRALSYNASKKPNRTRGDQDAEACRQSDTQSFNFSHAGGALRFFRVPDSRATTAHQPSRHFVESRLLLRRILPRPLPGNLLVPLGIVLVLLRNPPFNRIVRHGLFEQLPREL